MQSAVTSDEVTGSGTIDLKYVARVVNRRKWLILTSVVLVTGDAGRLLGVVGIDELLGALRRRPSQSAA